MKVALSKKSSVRVTPARADGPAAAAVEPPTLWHAMPGWGIAADLIPPELINARQLKVLRRLLAAALVVLLIVCAGGFYLAAEHNSAAKSELSDLQFRTSQLQAAGRLYSGVVSIQRSVSQVQTQIIQVMAGDVDLVALMNQLQSNLPKTMTISQEAVTISTAGVAGATTTPATGAASGGGLDTSGLPRIGTVTLSGTGRSLDDLPDYIDRLNTVTGLVDVLPISNTVSATGGGSQYSLTIGLTNALLSHRFEVKK